MTKSNDRTTPDPPVEAYLSAWRLDAQRPDLGEFLRQRPELSSEERFEVILVDQRIRWQMGDGRSIEDYLREFAQIADHIELIADLVYGEWLARGMKGPPLVSPSLASRFPDVSERLTRQTELLEWLCDEATNIVQASDVEGFRLAKTTVARDALTTPAMPRTIVAQIARKRASFRRWANGLLGLGALAACVAAMVLWSEQTPDVEIEHARDSVTSGELQRDATVQLSWTFDAYRAGDLSRRERLTTTPAAIYSGDAFRVEVSPSQAAFVYVYTIDPKGTATWLKTDPAIDPGQSRAFPEQSDQAISAPKTDGTMLWMAIVRSTPLEDPAAVADQLKFATPLPSLDVDTLLVDGTSLKAQPLLLEAGNDRDGVQLAELRTRLGEQYASRSVDPADPIAADQLAVAIRTWRDRLPSNLGNVHYLAIRVVNKTP